MTLIEQQKRYFKQHQTLDPNYRIAQLKRLRSKLDSYYSILVDAMRLDLNKNDVEAYMTEMSMIYAEIDYMIDAIPKWVKPERVPTSIAHFYSKSHIHQEPYGTVLIISPWNYPVQLALVPLIGAIAAGNCVILKPSEESPWVSRVLSLLIRDTFDEQYVAVREGDGEVSQSLLKEGVDYCFFTGSSPVGSAIMETAAKKLTPVTLELGGKSPTIVTDSSDLKHAARRIAWGKWINAGQTCIAPDYVLVDQSISDVFIDEVIQAIHQFYTLSPLTNPDYPKIINQKHYDRLSNLINQHNIAYGGKGDDLEKIIEPTLVINPGLESELMQEEIFGPILPIITYRQLDEAIEIIEDRSKPLALYLFTQDNQLKEKVVNELSFGGGAINDTLIHFTNHHLPFGGVGNSGIGKYHGKFSLETFSNQKGILEKTDKFDLPLRYPPYTNLMFRIIKLFF